MVSAEARWSVNILVNSDSDIGRRRGPGWSWLVSAYKTDGENHFDVDMQIYRPLQGRGVDKIR